MDANAGKFGQVTGVYFTQSGGDVTQHSGAGLRLYPTQVNRKLTVIISLAGNRFRITLSQSVLRIIQYIGKSSANFVALLSLLEGLCY